MQVDQYTHYYVPLATSKTFSRFLSLSIYIYIYIRPLFIDYLGEIYEIRYVNYYLKSRKP